MPEPVQSEKLTISDGEIKYWKAEIEASRRFRKEAFVKRIKYEKSIRYWEGEQLNSQDQSADRRALLNQYYPSFESVLSNSYVQNPTVSVKAKNPLADGNVQPIGQYMALNGPIQPVALTDLMKTALTYAADHYGLKNEAQLGLFDLLFAGFCCIEVNHSVIKDESAIQTAYKGMEENPGILDKVMNTAKRIMSGDFSGGDKEEVAQKVAAEQGSEKKDSSIDETYIQWWSPLDILFDYRAKVFSRSRYIVKETRMTLAEFKNMYPTAEYAQIGEDELKTSPYGTHSDKENSKMVTVCEVQIKKTDGMASLFLADGVDKELDYYKHPIKTNGFTIKYGCIDKYGTLYPISKACLALREQDELNHYVDIQKEHADRAPRKIAYWRDGLTDDGKRDIKNSDVYGLVEKKQPGAVFESVPMPAASQDTLQLIERHINNMNQIVGTNELAKSGQSTSKFMGQDELKDQSFDIMTSKVTDALQDVLLEVMDGLKDIIMQLWDGEVFLKVTGIPGGDFWYTPEMGKLPDIMTGDYLIEIDMSSVRRKNPIQDRNELTELVMGLLNPALAGFIQSKGYTLSISLVEEWIKSFGKNPKVVLEKLQPLPIPGQLNPLAPTQADAALSPAGPEPIDQEGMPDDLPVSMPV